MPVQKDLKRLVRQRMQKTGESYTAARARMLARRSPSTADFARIAGMSDEAVRRKTGHDWQGWVERLDAVDASSMPHREIARHLQEQHEISGWWAQTVTVGYERIRGLREVGQRRGGAYEANKSKTFPVPVNRLYRAFSVKRTRERWLPDVELKIRTSTVDRSMRISWPDGTSVHAYFTDKGRDKSSVALQHVGLDRKAEIERCKTFWAERLAELGRLLKE